ncbi:hypothetical protein [Actinokineospora globicatena]|uniref:hypothetical protein n=1 Tax=Actinokineospora globicatena TaxID=103729 RepID=UPI0020A40554|nr:hypothetical protein [Actinokineospora globicatena]GLW81262.1 hypothetical protein Aglo01_57430 [Actinokineospora globicatena]GLW88040.1 hypothetical protein Aglo02_56790 [Actinokineospora globicatena]
MLVEPVLGAGVLGDPTTELLVRLRPRASRAVMRSQVVLSALLLALLVFAVVDGDPVLATLLAATSLFSLWSLYHVWRLVRVSRVSAEILPGADWRPVDVAVHGAHPTGADVVVTVDGVAIPLHVYGLTLPFRAVLRRTGKAWLVDGGSVAAIRIEGSHEAFPATRVPKARPARKSEDADPTAVWARGLASRAMLIVLPFVAGVVTILGLTAFAQLHLFAVVTCLVLVVVVFGSRTVRYGHRWIDRQLPGLVAKGGWLPVGATASRWTPRVDSTTTTNLVLRLTDGAVAVLELPNAAADLLGTIHDTAGAWVAGPLTPGRVVAVGYPGYPLLAAGKVVSTEPA